jgi:putative ABC transport system permease protein
VIEITPLSQEETSRGFEVENRPPLAPGHFTAAQYRRISPNYFSTLNIPLIKGRALTDRDSADAAGVAVISVTMARRYWPDEDPLGKKLIIRDGGRNPREVIGIVGDVKHIGLDKQPQPVMYVPLAQRPVDRMTLVVRTAADPRQMINAVQGAVWSVDKDQPVFKIQTLDQIVAASVAAPRFAWILLGVFAGVALLLAGGGNLRCDGLRRDATDPGDRHSHGARRAIERPAQAASPPWSEAHDGGRDRGRPGRVGVDALDGEVALWRQCD